MQTSDSVFAYAAKIVLEAAREVYGAAGIDEPWILGTTTGKGTRKNASVRQALCVVLRDNFGMSYGEVARLMHVSVRNAIRNVKRGRELKEEDEDYTALFWALSDKITDYE